MAFLQEFDLFQDILKFNMGKIDADNKGRLGAFFVPVKKNEYLIPLVKF